MLIAVDVGNTSIKLAWCDDPQAPGWPEFSLRLSLATREPASWEALGELPPLPAIWCVGSVQREAETQLARWVAHHRPHDRYRKLENRDLPLQVQVEFPERVGSDRLLAAVAVNALRSPNSPAIVIDAGTAVTVDLVANDGAFQGGIIWPGWRLMAQTLAAQTDALPLVTGADAPQAPAIVGASTEKAIRSGLFWGNVGAVREFIAQIRATLPQTPEVFVTGGDALRWAEEACPAARRVEELVLSGIVLTARGFAW